LIGFCVDLSEADHVVVIVGRRIEIPCSDNDFDTTGQEPDGCTAEEVLLEIYSQKTRIVESGGRPDRVVLSMDRYRLIQEYRARLGDVPPGMTDYLGKYELFGLPVYLDNDAACRVETETDREHLP
jgi:hypothetical protein